MSMTVRCSTYEWSQDMSKKTQQNNKQKRTCFDCIAEAEIITYYIGISTEEIKKYVHEIPRKKN